MIIRSFVKKRSRPRQNECLINILKFYNTGFDSSLQHKSPETAEAVAGESLAN